MFGLMAISRIDEKQKATAETPRAPRKTPRNAKHTKRIEFFSAAVSALSASRRLHLFFDRDGLH
jgi:hypothetical protein